MPKLSFQKGILLLLAMVCQGLFAQVKFDVLPKYFSLIPRNTTSNFGDARIKGKVTSTAYNTVMCKVFQNGKSYANFSQNLVFSSGSAPFDLLVKLKAGRFRYDLQLIFWGTDTMEVKVSDVVVGDVYIIQGQSNAVANSYGGLSQPKYGDSFIRSFGSSSYDPATSAADTFWHLANGDGYYNQGCIGQWGLVMAKKLLDSFGVPIGILNGAVGGTSVTYHQRFNSQPDHIYTCYGRLLTRVRKAGLEKNIRGILWFQGESDGTQPQLHDSLFRILYSDWFRDYKGIQKNYMVQVRGGGCGSPTPEMLEKQRQFEFTLNKLQVVSSNGLNGHDGCHYALKNGYEQLGLQFAALLGRDLYGSGRKRHIDPPQINKAYYSNGSFTEITLEMTHPFDSVFVDAGFYNLFSVSGDNSVYIVSGVLRNNQVVLQLNQGSCKTLDLTYMGMAGTQNWVKNRLGMGLIGFDKIPVTKREVRSVYSGCANQWIWLGEDSISGCKYVWTNLQTGNKKTSAKIREILKNDGLFGLVITYSGSGCKSDSQQVNAVLDKTPKPFLGEDTILCNHSVWRSSWMNYAEVRWAQNNRVETTPVFETTDSGNIILNVSTSLGCNYSDTIRISTSSPSLKLTAPSFICPGTDTMVSATKGYPQYIWNGSVDSNSSFRTKPGIVVLNVMDNMGCTVSDTVVIGEYEKSLLPVWNYALCPYDSVQIQKPPVVYQWLVNQVNSGASPYLKPGKNEILWSDMHNCNYNNNVDVVKKEIPKFYLGNDTSVCIGNHVVFHCNFTASAYWWNNQLYPSPDYSTQDSGNLVCRVRNEQGCEYSDTVNLHYHEMPNFYLPKDTVLCNGTIWSVSLPANCEYDWNGVPARSIEIKYTGTNRIAVKNIFGCAEEKSVYVTYKSCTNGLSEIGTSLYVFPNPCKDKLELVIKRPCGFYITNAVGKKMYEGWADEKVEINVSSWSTGMYVFRSTNGIVRFWKE